MCVRVHVCCEMFTFTQQKGTATTCNKTRHETQGRMFSVRMERWHWLALTGTAECATLQRTPWLPHVALGWISWMGHVPSNMAILLDSTIAARTIPLRRTRFAPGFPTLNFQVVPLWCLRWTQATNMIVGYEFGHRFPEWQRAQLLSSMVR